MHHQWTTLVQMRAGWHGLLQTQMLRLSQCMAMMQPKLQRKLPRPLRRRDILGSNQQWAATKTWFHLTTCVIRIPCRWDNHGTNQRLWTRCNPFTRSRRWDSHGNRSSFKLWPRVQKFHFNRSTQPRWTHSVSLCNRLLVELHLGKKGQMYIICQLLLGRNMVIMLVTRPCIRLRTLIRRRDILGPWMLRLPLRPMAARTRPAP